MKDVDIDENLIARADYWVKLMDSGLVSNSERKAFDEWLAESKLHIQIYRERKLLIWRKLTESNSDPQLLPKDNTTAVVQISSAFIFCLQSIKAWLTTPVGAITAIIMCLACVTTYFSVNLRKSNIITYQSALDEVRNVYLRDGSLITLGANSLVEIRYEKNHCFVDLLHGRAFFDFHPRKDKIFWVHVNSTKIKPINTRFDVRIGADSVVISVVDGSVRVFDESFGMINENYRDTFILLGENQHLHWKESKALLNKQILAEGEIALWRHGQLNFHNSPLDEVISDVNRYLEKPLQLGDPDLADMSVTASFNAEQATAIPQYLTRLLSLHAQEEAEYITLMSVAMD